MLTTIACVVFFASIVMFFSDELRSTGVTLFKSPKFKLIAPLFLCSWIVINYEWAILMAILYIRLGLYYLVYIASKITPWDESKLIFERILTLITIAFLPLGIADLTNKFLKIMINIRPIVLQISLFLWVISAFLLAIGLLEYYS